MTIDCRMQMSCQRDSSKLVSFQHSLQFCCMTNALFSCSLLFQLYAVELGTSALLVDEDACATNFMIRDDKMMQLVAPDKEPITPFVRKVRSPYEDLGISSILVVGGTVDYLMSPTMLSWWTATNVWTLRNGPNKLWLAAHSPMGMFLVCRISLAWFALAIHAVTHTKPMDR